MKLPGRHQIWNTFVCFGLKFGGPFAIRKSFLTACASSSQPHDNIFCECGDWLLTNWLLVMMIEWRQNRIENRPASKLFLDRTSEMSDTTPTATETTITTTETTVVQTTETVVTAPVAEEPKKEKKDKHYKHDKHEGGEHGDKKKKSAWQKFVTGATKLEHKMAHAIDGAEHKVNGATSSANQSVNKTGDKVNDAADKEHKEHKEKKKEKKEKKEKHHHEEARPHEEAAPQASHIVPAPEPTAAH
jgi:hypothetical protein